MLRFTIRELLWLTVVVALLVAWAIDHQRLSSRDDEAALWRDVALKYHQRVLQLQNDALARRKLHKTRPLSEWDYQEPPPRNFDDSVIRVD